MSVTVWPTANPPEPENWSGHLGLDVRPIQALVESRYAWFALAIATHLHLQERVPSLFAELPTGKGTGWMADHDAIDRQPDREAACEQVGARISLKAPARWSFCHLPFAYQLVVWAARTWNREAATPAQRWSTIRQAFAHVNAEDATVPFLRLMEVVQTGARHAILIGEGGCTVFSDEVRFAEILASAACGDATSLDCRLRALLVPSAARVARGLVQDVTAELTRAGLRFSRTMSASEPEVLPRGVRFH